MSPIIPLAALLALTVGMLMVLGWPKLEHTRWGSAWLWTGSLLLILGFGVAPFTPADCRLQRPKDTPKLSMIQQDLKLSLHTEQARLSRGPLHR